jgi:hypothetical protein
VLARQRGKCCWLGGLSDGRPTEYHIQIIGFSEELLASDVSKAARQLPLVLIPKASQRELVLTAPATMNRGRRITMV